MKIMFVNPKHHPHSMNFHHCMDIVGVKYSHMPLSLPTLAALTLRIASSISLMKMLML